ncbi:hypothetical protein [Sinanaerobacter sp. ZZT-01]|uniref:hypothetical protein n=1 Tax=Sinanaerobacter sp. ZZT-01 TaxID=3111540 RepID=UPI002D776971|nr:hypothetical protein [Sinanaerobacter sp. ZZT-01]WRR92685.1 hypothetical protein U5921_11610 [Sinanaerobacter sp. ZZT-01]
MRITELNYKNFLELEPTFLSLDISVRSTGWVLSTDKNISFGINSLKVEDELGRRLEFRTFLLDLIGNKHIPVIFVEDVYGGVNFKTVKGLIQLNTIVDDLKADKLILVEAIKRIDNKKWKKYLKQAANYKLGAEKNDKEIVTSCLNELGFNLEVKQDVYDALGMAVGVIYKDKVLKV